MKKDILQRDDIEKWMQTFYEKLTSDTITSKFFEHIHLETHLPKIVDFWCFVLLDQEGYTTNVFGKHVDLKLEEIHFRTWIKHFCETTDELFEGENASKAKQRAKLLASTFYHKMSGVYIVF